MSDVFVSHATKDDKAVDDLYSLLTAAGLTVWVDHKNGIVPGDDWSDSIHHAANDCAYGLFVMSPRSVKSKYCKAECNRVLRLDKRLYIVVIEKVEVKDIPLRLDIIQQVDLTKDFDAGMNALIEAIKGRRELDTKAATVSIPRRLVNFDPRLVSIPLSGRDDDVSAIKLRLGRAPTFILGVGGLGKTRLAAEIALTSQNVVGGVWHTASDYSRADEILEGLRDYFNLPNTIERREVLAILRHQKLLIVIDNAESPTDERRKEYAQLVNEMYAQGAQVLFTSRVEWDEVRDPQTWTPQTLPLEAAAKVVGDMADAFSSPHATALKTHAEDFARAARQHPRLIEWAVRQTKKFAPEKVLEDLRTLKSKAVQEALDEMIRKTLRQMVSEDGAALETVLKKLCVCRGGFSYEAAQAILELNDDDTLDEQLAALQTWQFVTMRVLADGRTRYDIDALVIEAVGEDEGVHKSHYDYYKILAKQYDQKQNYMSLDIESSNLEVAFEWTLLFKHMTLAYELANSCINFMINRGRFTLIRNWLERVESLLSVDSNERLIIGLQICFGIVYAADPTNNKFENLQIAISRYNDALKLLSFKKAPFTYAVVQNNLGSSFSELAEYENKSSNLKYAINAYYEALKYYTPEIAPLSYAMIQNNIGCVLCDLSKLEGNLEGLTLALNAFKEALRYWTPKTAPLDYSMVHNNMGNTYRALANNQDRNANLNRALNEYDEALKYTNSENSAMDYATIKRNLGITYKALNRLPEAINCWNVAQNYYQVLGDLKNAQKVRVWIQRAKNFLDQQDQDTMHLDR